MSSTDVEVGMNRSNCYYRCAQAKTCNRPQIASGEGEYYFFKMNDL